MSAASASTSQLPSSSTPPPYTLYAYTPSPTSHPDLPLLDPSALYAACLLLNANVAFGVSAPNTWIHSTLPRLESNASGGTIVVAEGVKEIEQFAKRACPTSSSSFLKPLEAHISTHLEPLIYSVFFPVPTVAGEDASDFAAAGDYPASMQIFNQITFKAYSSGLPFPTSRIVPHRLREAIVANLSSSSSTLYSALTSHDYSPQLSADEKHRQEQAKKLQAQMKQLDSDRAARLLRFGAAKQGWREEFVRQRTESAARDVLTPITTFIKTYNDSRREEAQLPPTLLHLFALLAPLVLHSSSSILAKHPIAQLLASEEQYAPLKQLIHKVYEQLLSAQRAKLDGDAKRWTKIVLGDVSAAASPSATEPSSYAETTSSSRRSRDDDASRASSWSSYLASFVTTSPEEKAKRAKEEAQLTERERKQRRKLNIMRAVWLTTSVVGSISWVAFLVMSGAVSIEVRDADGGDDDDDEEEEEEGEADGEEEAEEGWVFTRSGEDVDDEEDEEDVDFDDVEDENDFDDDE